jgi:SAM-dependent methyltransferase
MASGGVGLRGGVVRWHGECTALAQRMPEELIYRLPRDYDLEHEGDDDDVAFFVQLVRDLAPRRVLELASGSGRVTMPLAELAAERGIDLVGLEASGAMLAAAEEKRVRLPAAAQGRVTLERGDMRSWEAPDPFDLIVVPCSSVCHLLTLEDQLATWRTARRNLAPRGRFVVDVVMPDLVSYAESLHHPPRALVQLDSDTTDDRGQRLLRYKTTEYRPHEQRAQIRFVYDKLEGERHVGRYVSDFESHVYFPRELELLFRVTGFSIERTCGDYRGRPLGRRSSQIIMVGVAEA